MATSRLDPGFFQAYQEKLLSHPFERTLEAFRKRAILETLSTVKLQEIETVLEVGIGLGGVALGLQFQKETVIVEPIADFIEMDQGRNYVGTVEYFAGTVESYLAQLDTSRQFDLVILSSVLHELPNPQDVLSALKRHLNPKSLVIAVVPNQESIHRLVGLGLGILKDKERTPSEVAMSQVAAYSIVSLASLLNGAGYDILSRRTFLPKILSSSQMQDALNNGLLSEAFLEECFRNSASFEPYGSEILVVARPSEKFK